MALLSLRGLSKHFDAVNAVRSVTLEILSGEFFSILGPSGCGKTTLLRMIAGFDTPSEGAVLLDGRDITSTLPQDRAIGMVFQNYALFPHMTVAQNVAFGLETKGTPRGEIERRVAEALASVDLTGRGPASVAVLSGGEQQRVAVARALVVNPAVLLFDEPLSNLDVALRIRTREEIRSLQRKTGITTIYVTHDQSEAMSLSHRIAVMREGIVEQVGTPAEVYESPSSPFVASFLGGATVHRATYDPANRVLQVGSATFHIQQETHSLRPGSLTVAIKPESIELLFGSGGEVQARIEEKEYLGFTTNFALRISGVAFRAASVSNEFTDRLAPGDTVSVRIHWSRCSIFPDGAE